MIDTLPLIYFISGTVGIVIFILLVYGKKIMSQNLFLSFCILSLSIGCLYNLALEKLILRPFPTLAVFLTSFVYMVAPSAYLYIRNSIFWAKKISWYDGLHFIPFAVYFIYSLVDNKNSNIPDFWMISDVGFFRDNYLFSIIILCIWIYYSIQNLIWSCMPSNYSSLFGKQLNIKWMKFFSMMILLLFSLIAIEKLASDTNQIIGTLINTIMPVIIMVIAISVLLKPQLFLSDTQHWNFESVDGNIVATHPDAKSMGPLLTQSKIEEYVVIINDLFDEEEPFLKKGFVIRDLSELTKIPIHHLSFLINSEYNLHFQDFINQRRIEYIKDNIGDEEWKNLSLEGIAWAVGFNSRTTFFRAFIKLTGESPSEYLKAEKLRRKEHGNSIIILKKKCTGTD